MSQDERISDVFPERHIDAVRRQFGRQAEAYETVPIVTDPEFLSYIVSISKVGKGDIVLDLASGPGFIAMAFAPHCREVVGVDATERFVARATAEAARRRLDNVSFALGVAENLPFKDNRFDLAVCRFAFHHFLDPPAVLREMRRVVRPGGNLILIDMVASEDPAKAAYHNELERLCDPSHARALPASEFEQMFADQTFELEYKQSIKSSYTVDQWLAHGAPSADRAARIIRMLEASLSEDKCGLSVRRADGQMHFSHAGACYRLRKRL
jgi:ubiquinone/menaquinone biosynthesis C-methylase UbiE